MKTNPYEATWITECELRTPYVHLIANDQYWDKKRGPRVSEIIFRNDLTKEQALDLCMNTEGQVDIVSMVEPKEALHVIEAPFANLIKVNANRVFAGVFNRFQTDVNFNDRRLRYAMNLAVNKKRLIEVGFLGHATSLPSLTPTWSPELPEDITPIGYNPTEAKQLLHEVGWPVNRFLKIAVIPEYREAAKVIAEDIEVSLGINVEVIKITETEKKNWQRSIAEKRRIPDIDLYLTDVFSLFTVAIPAFIHREFFGESGALRMGPELKSFDDLFTAYASEISEKKRIKVAKEVDRYVHRKH
nr:ABC transporter substrate-binding protein [Anaerobacillus sp. CMMVII]